MSRLETKTKKELIQEVKRLEKALAVKHGEAMEVLARLHTRRKLHEALTVACKSFVRTVWMMYQRLPPSTSNGTLDELYAKDVRELWMDKISEGAEGLKERYYDNVEEKKERKVCLLRHAKYTYVSYCIKITTMKILRL